MKQTRRWLCAALIAMIGLLALGTAGYALLGGLSLIDALYQTIITISTVGYTDLAPELKTFTLLITLLGVVVMAVFVSLITVILVEEQVLAAFGRRRVEKQIEKLSDHTVLCGFGNFGRVAARDLKKDGTPFVVIELNPTRAAQGREMGYSVVEADATEEDSLVRAGLRRAKSIMTTLASDADNVYVALTAKQLCPEILVVSIARDQRAQTRLEAAGVDRVISPYNLAGTWMASVVLRPTVSDFLEMATGHNALDFYMEQQQVAEGSSLVGKALKDTSIRRELGVIIVGVKRASSEMITNPPPDTLLCAGDVLVSLGKRESLSQLQRMATG